MKKSILLLSFLFLSFSFIFAQSELPDVQLKTLEGKTVSIRDYIQPGKPTVISFWATWCSPCKRELDAINEIYAEWQEKYNVSVIAVTIDDARSLTKVKPMVEQKGWKYTVLSDAGQNLKQALNAPSVPQSFLIDGNGKIIWTHAGYAAGDEMELEEQLENLAGKR